VQLGGVPPDAVRVELYADGDDVMPVPMTRDRHAEGSANGYVFTASVPAPRPASDWTPRVIPDHPCAVVPLEASYILWGR
jgi:glycogen phosphorylase